MKPAITLEELLAWTEEAAVFWKAHLDANPALLELPCGIDEAESVRGFVRHIWGAELIWSQRIAGLPTRDKADWPAGPLDVLFNMHLEAMKTFRSLLDAPTENWEQTMTFNFAWLQAKNRTLSRRKLMAHALFHGHRHWAQLATLLRTAGHPTGLVGDLIFSSALE